MRIVVNKHQRALLYKNGDFLKMLAPGKHWLFGFGLRAQLYSVEEPFAPPMNLTLYLEDEELAKELLVVEVGQNELGLLLAGRLFRFG